MSHDPSRGPVTVAVREVTTDGFDGAGTLVTVVTLATSGVLGGLTAAIGEDVWNGVRGIVRRRTRSTRAIGPATPGRVVLVVSLTTPGRTREIRYSADVDDERAVSAIRAIIADLEARDADDGERGVVRREGPPDPTDP